MSLIRMFMSARYKECLNYPIYILAVVIALCLWALTFIDQFEFDASDDTLVAEGDPDLAYYREVSKSFGGDDFLFLTYAPESGSVFNNETLLQLDSLGRELESIQGVRSVSSILDAPLLKNPPVALADLTGNVKTLRSPGIDLSLAEQEFTHSPLFRELLVSADGRSTAIRIDLIGDTSLPELRDEIDRLGSLQTISESESDTLERLQSEYRIERKEQLARNNKTLSSIRSVRDGLDDEVVAHLGGIPLVVSDMIEYVKGDIVVFGTAVFTLIGIMLFGIFRRLRWVVLPLIATATSILLTSGLLGYLGQPVTVISSNFVSLIAIISISFSIHLISQYRELRARQPDLPHTDLVFNTMTEKLTPCVYTAMTTMVAFGSLTTSSIVPVRDFGWIMCIGVLVSFLVSYSLFAGLLLLLPKGEAATTLHHEPALTRFMGYLSTQRTGFILILSCILFGFSILGISRLSLDNRFIDYFRENTEIHQGLAYIDENIGGTIPLDIILTFPPYQTQSADLDDDFFTEVVDDYPQRYWYTPDKIQILARFQEYLNEKPEVGKIISVATLEQIGRTFNDGQALNSVELVAAMGAVPEDIRRELISPYASPEDGLLRISMRLHETGPAFSHQELIDSIYAFAKNELQIPEGNIRVTGMAVLFNGMLEDLFDSQQSTLIFVIAATFLLFLFLLRSAKLALIGLVPNILAAATILAFMGFVNIPLDMMTITIAAIIIGIGVDDAIHYLHRFKIELLSSRDTRSAVIDSQRSIGDAIYYTSITVVLGFSVLGLSNFIPTVHFGVLTALAMILALMANLTVLPALLVFFYQPTRSPEEN